MRNISRNVAVLLAMVVIAAVGAVAPAQASSPGSAAAPLACPITEYGYTGQRVCGFGWDEIDNGGGNVEYFVVGLDYAIWHIWKYSNGWQSLGGKARSAAPNGAWLGTDGANFYVYTIGTDNNWYCRNWPWTDGWYRCQP